MNKKILVFLLVVIGLGGIVWWQGGGNGGSPEERFARAIKLMEGLQSRAIPIAFDESQAQLLEGVYQDSLVRLPNIQGFRNTDKQKLIQVMADERMVATGSPNGLNALGESIITVSLGRTDEYNSNINSYISDLGSVAQSVKDEVKRLSQSVNTLTNDIRLTLLYISWYETIRPTLCTTNDPNNDIFTAGEVRFRYSTQLPLTDSCETSSASYPVHPLRQYKCINGQYTPDDSHTSVTQCATDCSNGVCLQANQSGFEIIGPNTATVGTPISLRVKAIAANGSANTGYTGTFFLIVAGDDDATFPSGAQTIPSGQSDTTISGITFSKAGTMTVTIRGTDNLETSKIVVVSSSGGPQNCGNNIREGTEQCDDGNTNNGDGCSNACLSQSYVKILSPNGGETYQVGQQMTINWESSSDINRVMIGYSTCESCLDWITNGGPITNTGNHSWTVQTGYSGGNARIRIIGYSDTSSSVEDLSDAAFTFSSSRCGNGVKESQEQCDDGNSNNADICNNLCQVNNSVITCNSLFIDPPTLTNGGTINYECTDNIQLLCLLGISDPAVCSGITKSIVLKDSTGAIVQTNSTASGLLIVPSTPAGTYSAECYVNGQTTTPADCKKTITNQAQAGPACTGTLPSHTSVLMSVGATSRAWTYDSSSTGPYQNCSFKCETGFTYNGTSCVSSSNTVTASCTGTLPSHTSVLENVGATSRAWTYDGSTTVPHQNCTFKCETGFTYNGTSCTANTTSVPVFTGGPMSITDIKDCWFGSTTRRITLGEFLGYQADPNTNSGMLYIDEVLLYGSNTPTANESLTNILSYEGGAWTSANNTGVTTSTQLTNFFVFRTNSPGTRTWNIPATGINHYGCFSRGDRPAW